MIIKFHDRIAIIKDRQGVTLIELVVAMAIITILVSGILPLSQVVYKRSREMELKRNLRAIRSALDAYKTLSDKREIPVAAFSSGYPPTLDTLAEGIEKKDAAGTRIKLLRRIPKDPMVEDGQWGLRSYADPPDSQSWGGQDVYDIYSKSDQKALDGTYYRDW